MRHQRFINSSRIKSEDLAAYASALYVIDNLLGGYDDKEMAPSALREFASRVFQMTPERQAAVSPHGKDGGYARTFLRVRLWRLTARVSMYCLYSLVSFLRFPVLSCILAYFLCFLYILMLSVCFFPPCVLSTVFLLDSLVHSLLLLPSSSFSLFSVLCPLLFSFSSLALSFAACGKGLDKLL